MCACKSYIHIIFKYTKNRILCILSNSLVSFNKIFGKPFHLPQHRSEWFFNDCDITNYGSCNTPISYPKGYYSCVQQFALGCEASACAPVLPSQEGAVLKVQLLMICLYFNLKILKSFKIQREWKIQWRLLILIPRPLWSPARSQFAGFFCTLPVWTLKPPTVYPMALRKAPVLLASAMGRIPCHPTLNRIWAVLHPAVPLTLHLHSLLFLQAAFYFYTIKFFFFLTLYCVITMKSSVLFLKVYSKSWKATKPISITMTI